MSVIHTVVVHHCCIISALHVRPLGLTLRGDYFSLACENPHILDFILDFIPNFNLGLTSAQPRPVSTAVQRFNAMRLSLR